MIEKSDEDIIKAKKYSTANVHANNRYIAKYIKKVTLNIRINEYEQIFKNIEASGKSTNAWILEAI